MFSWDQLFADMQRISTLAELFCFKLTDLVTMYYNGAAHGLKALLGFQSNKHCCTHFVTIVAATTIKQHCDVQL